MGLPFQLRRSGASRDSRNRSKYSSLAHRQYYQRKMINEKILLDVESYEIIGIENVCGEYVVAAW